VNTNKQYLVILVCVAIAAIIAWLVFALFPKFFEKKHTGHQSILKHQATWTLVSLSVQLVGVAVFTVIAYALCVWLPVSSFTQGFLAVLAGVLAWSKLLFKTPGLKIPMYAYFFVTNQPLHARVVGKLLTVHQARSEKIVVGPDNPLRSFDSSSLREIGPGTHGILPWERTVRVITLKAQIVIGNGFDENEKPLVVQTKNKVPLEMAWLTRLSALQGWLVNLVQYTDKGQIKEFGAVFRTFLIGWASQYTDDEIFAFMKSDKAGALENAFKQLLGGKGGLHQFEKDRGMFSGDPQFNGVRYQAGYLEAQQALAKADMVSKARAKLVEGLTPKERAGLSPDMVLLMATQMAGALGNIEPFLIIGGGISGCDPSLLASALAEGRKDKKGGGDKGGKGKPSK